jgi:cephalosporin hydroxylase
MSGSSAPGTILTNFPMLAEIVDSPCDLSLGQWYRLRELALAAEPDLIVEVGRGYGNSTVVLTEGRACPRRSGRERRL